MARKSGRLSPVTGKPARLYDGDIFERAGYAFRVTFQHDPDSGPPWEHSDGHGPVSDWTTRDKAPGERILASDRHSRRYYDVVEATKIAKRDGWGCGDKTHKHTGTRSRAACAVEKDFEFLRRWCADEWQYCGVVVVLVEDDRDMSESIWGIEDDADAYLTETAYELADQIVRSIEVAAPDAVLSEN